MFCRLSVFGFLLFFTTLNSFGAPSQWQRPNGKIDHELEIIDFKQQLKYLDTGARGFNIVYDCWKQTYDVVLEVQEDQADAPGTIITTPIFYSFSNIDALVTSLLSNPYIGFVLKNTSIEPRLKEFETKTIAPTSLQLDVGKYKVSVLEKDNKLTYVTCDSDRNITRTSDLSQMSHEIKQIEALYSALSSGTLKPETASLIKEALGRKKGIFFVEKIATLLSQTAFEQWPADFKKEFLSLLAWRVQPQIVLGSEIIFSETATLFKALGMQKTPPQQYWALVNQIFDHYYAIMNHTPMYIDRYWSYRTFVGKIFQLNTGFSDEIYKNLLRFVFDSKPVIHETGMRILSYLNQWPESLFDFVLQDKRFKNQTGQILKLISTRAVWSEKMKDFVLQQLKNTNDDILTEAILTLGNKKTWDTLIWEEIVQVLKNNELGKNQNIFNALIRAMTLRTEVPATYQDIYQKWLTTKFTTNERDFYRQMGRQAIDPLMKLTQGWTQKTVCTDLSQTIKNYQNSITNGKDPQAKALDYPLQLMTEIFLQERRSVCLPDQKQDQFATVEKLLSSENPTEIDPFTLTWKKSLPYILDRIPGVFEDVDILYSRVFYARLLTYYLRQNLFTDKYDLKEKAAEHLIRIMISMIDVSHENFTKGINETGILGSNIQMYAQALMFSTLLDMVPVLDFSSYHIGIYRQTRAKLVGLYQHISDALYKIMERERAGQWGLSYSALVVDRRIHHSIGMQESRARTASWLSVLKRANHVLNPTLDQDKKNLLEQHFNAALNQAVADRYLLLHIFQNSVIPHDESEMQTGSHYLFANTLLLTKELMVQYTLEGKRKDDLKKLWNVYRLTYDESEKAFSSNFWWEGVTRRMNTLMAGISLIDYLAIQE